VRFYKENKEEAFRANVKKLKQKYNWDSMLTTIDEVVEMSKTVKTN